MKKIILGTMLSLLSFSVLANIVINSTRVIYPSDKKEVSVQLLNTGEQPSLVQAWIDNGDPNSTPETAKVPFFLTPPVVKVDGKNGQQLRIKYLQGDLPQDRESIFYLNVLDIPPVPENAEGKNVMQIAVRSRIKLFYRPIHLKTSIKDINKEIRLSKYSQGVKIENKSPYYITIVSLMEKNSKNNELTDGVLISPFSDWKFEQKSKSASNGPFTLLTIDDFGSLNKVTLNIQ